MKCPMVALALTLAVGWCTHAVAGEMDMPVMKSSPAFDQIKSLVGNWEGQNQEGKPVKVSYQLVSGGSCVMETLDSPDGGSMITMYHMDRHRLTLDHYCMLNNVPHMRAAPSTDVKHLKFSYVGASNLASPQDMHMHALTLGMEDPDHLTHTWVLRTKGKDQPEEFRFQRVK